MSTEHIDDLVQDCSISIANKLEILQFCTETSICQYAAGSEHAGSHIELELEHTASNIHVRAISQEITQPSITKISLNITTVKYLI